MEQKSKTEENYERMLFAIAVLYALQIGLNPNIQDEYSKLSPALKTFAKKTFEDNPDLKKQVESDKRLSEKTLTEDMAKLSQDEGNDLKKIVTAGDLNVCQHCKRWQNKIVSLSGKDNRYPSLQNAIDDGFLHYGCKCYLAELSLKEIPRKHASNVAYNNHAFDLVFN